jgi:hypothetical protein
MELEGLGDLNKNLGNEVKKGVGVVFMNDKKKFMVM